MRALALACLVLVACAHAPDLALRPDPSPPAGSTVETFAAGDGTQLLARRWAAIGDTRAVVVIMHGLKDYSARYANLATRLAAAGYAVYAFDLRGHGRSAGPRVAPADWMDYVDDLDRFLASVEKREPGKHVYLFGHSMGGAIATLAAERHAPKLAGLMLSGPALVADAPPLQLAGAMLADALTPHAPALGLDNRDFSSDPGNAAKMDIDPMIPQPAAPAHTAAGLLRGMATAWAGIDALTMPILAMHGTADKLTAPWGSRELVRRAPSTDKTLRLYDDANHDLVHEPNGRGDQVEKEMIAWLDAHEGGQPFVAEPDPPGAHRRLAGRPRGWAQAVQLEAGVGQDSTFAGRLAVELARPAPLGWHGALIASRLDGLTTIALQPAGIAARLDAVVVGVSGGASLVGPQTDQSVALALSGGAWAEVPLGPLHLGLTGEVDHPFSTNLTYELGAASLRLGEDHAYWPHAHAGAGPVVTAGVLRASAGGTASATAWFAMLGLELYGAD